ncbi:MAG: sulfite exporter TauE/SafE family protein [Chitinophagaceae bacterium]|nr:sulfite exporter TauE/SafE family protein [Chitinophagaceae bacterium]MCB9044794.1 sulfite exporter TauE/SafE family protein [Chitinophagales bacterium]
MPHWELLLFFFVIAFVYASVGFGGGSSYLAILALYALPFKEIRLTALICNIIVVTGGTIIFIRNKQVDLRKILPLVLISVPMAYLGATMKISEQTFFIILGCSLIVAAMLLWVQTQKAKANILSINGEANMVKDSALGGGIGFLSGMVGIGGGIFLAPLLNLLKWDAPRKIAATASVFILVNSLAGIAGQITQLPDNINYRQISLLCIAVFAGGQLGSRMGAVKLNPLWIRRLTALLVFAAGVNVLIKHL